MATNPKSISELLDKLAVAHAQLKTGERGTPYQEVFKKLRQRIDDKKRNK